MSRKWSRTKLVVASIATVLGLLPAAILGIVGYLRATAPLHTNVADVPVTQSSPLPERAAAAEQARQIVRAALVEQNLPGLSAAVGVGGDVVWAEGAGWADLERRVPVAPDMRFRIGTASVALTSAAVGMLLEKKRIDLDEEIQAYVPAFPKKPWAVTLRQVMAHLSGVRNDGGDEGPLLAGQCLRPVDALQAFADRPLLFEPGTQHRYSSYGWILVSAAIEAVAEEPFLTFMQARIFEPLGMRDTQADSATEPIASRVTPYFPRFAADPLYGLHLMRPIDYSCYAGASAFLSTPSDLVRFGMAIDSGTLLQPATVELLQTSQRLNSGEDTAYGLGWDVETVTLAGKQTRVAGHDGTSLGGTVASLLVFRDLGIVVAVTSNISYADTRAVALKIAEAFADNRGQ